MSRHWNLKVKVRFSVLDLQVGDSIWVRKPEAMRGEEVIRRKRRGTADRIPITINGGEDDGNSKVQTF